MVIEQQPVNNRFALEQPDASQPITEFLHEITNKIIHEEYLISPIEAMRIGMMSEDESMLLFHHANQIRKHFRGDTVGLCSIVNAKSGACSEDCSFCSQSAHFKTASPVYKLMKPEEVLKYARQAEQDGAEHIGIVISGYGIRDDKELHAIGEIVKRCKEEVGIEVHASVGIVDKPTIEYLRDCGVTMINHNLETSASHYPNVCTTHTYEERMETLKTAQACGVKVCSGGIFGMGETLDDRIEMAMTLREINPETVPLNFLHAIDGTPLEGMEPIPPVEILMTISLYRFILPKSEIKICGGREKNLRDFQSMIFFAGADSMMIGNYLTTAGREPELDYQMMKDLGLKWNTMPADA